MGKKIVGIWICMLVIITAIPATTSLKNIVIDTMVPNYPLVGMGGNWTERQKLFPSDGAAEDNFGNLIDFDTDTVCIGANGDDDNGVDSGSAYIFIRNGNTWTQQAKLFASDGAAYDMFGTVGLDGDTAFVGAHNDDDNGPDSGSVYIFTRNGTTWTQQQKLLASDGAAGDIFSGWAVSLDGSTALIGAIWDDDNGVNSGSTYVFTRFGTNWTQQQKLLASDGAAGDEFGVFSLDGGTVFITAWYDDDNGVNSGSAYVFTKENEPPVADFSWTPQNPKTNEQITFDASTSQDPDGTITLYEWDWDNDGTYDESHPTPTATHSWTNTGSHPVTVRVTDDKDTTDTSTKTVEVSGAANFTIEITGGFGIKTTITNTGTLDATNIQWKYTLTGGLILLGKTKSGTITSLVAGKSATAKDSPILGFGKTTIQVEVTCAEGISVTKTATGNIFLFFVVGVKQFTPPLFLFVFAQKNHP